VKKEYFLKITVLYFMMMSIMCYADNSSDNVVIDFDGIGFDGITIVTDLTKEGTHIFDSASNKLHESNNIYKKFKYIDGFIYKIDGSELNSTPINKTSINMVVSNHSYHFYRFIKVINNYLLYFISYSEEINCDAFMGYYKLYKINLTSGKKTELIEFNKSYNTVGGCYSRYYKPEPKPPKVWHPFFSKSGYKSSDYSMRKDIDYFELRHYLFDKKGKQVTNKYIPYLVIANKKLSSYSQKVIRKFQNIPFKNSSSANIKTKDSIGKYIFKDNGFIIKKDKSMWTINEKKDLIWLFDGIDTEAELYLFLQVYNIDSSGYIKTSNGYDVLHSKYIYHIQSDGQFTKELRKEKNISNNSKERDKTESFKSLTLEEILKDKRFITPMQ